MIPFVGLSLAVVFLVQAAELECIQPSMILCLLDRGDLDLRDKAGMILRLRRELDGILSALENSHDSRDRGVDEGTTPSVALVEEDLEVSEEVALFNHQPKE